MEPTFLITWQIAMGIGAVVITLFGFYLNQQIKFHKLLRELIERLVKVEVIQDGIIKRLDNNIEHDDEIHEMLINRLIDMREK